MYGSRSSTLTAVESLHSHSSFPLQATLSDTPRHKVSSRLATLWLGHELEFFGSTVRSRRGVPGSSRITMEEVFPSGSMWFEWSTACGHCEAGCIFQCILVDARRAVTKKGEQVVPCSRRSQIRTVGGSLPELENVEATRHYQVPRHVISVYIN